MTIADVAGSSGDVAALGFEAWSAAVSSTFVPLAATPRVPVDRFRGAVDSATTGGVQMTRVRGGGAEIRRSAGTIRRADPGVIKVALAVAGTSTVQQHDRAAALSPGDLVVYDTSAPYRLALTGDFDMLVAVIDRSRLPVADRDLRDATARTVAGTGAIGAILRPAMLAMRPGSADAITSAGTFLESALIDLVTAALRVNGTTAPAAGDAVYRAARDHIEAHLADPGLSPGGVAAQVGVSMRYLQKLFAADGDSVAAFIRRRRLERCRLDLANPALAQRPITAIAHLNGFADASHFSRLFHAEFGWSPREYRHTVVG